MTASNCSRIPTAAPKRNERFYYGCGPARVWSAQAAPDCIDAVSVRLQIRLHTGNRFGGRKKSANSVGLSAAQRVLGCQTTDEKSCAFGSPHEEGWRAHYRLSYEVLTLGGSTRQQKTEIGPRGRGSTDIGWENCQTEIATRKFCSNGAGEKFRRARRKERCHQ